MAKPAFSRGVAKLASGIELAYETCGDPQGQPVLLIMGLGMQLTAWPEPFCFALAKLGLYVIRFDNRDIGLSTPFDHAPTVGVGTAMLRAMLGMRIEAPYRVEDMAHDTVGLLDALGIARAHVIGVSMGGMIAQMLAAMYPMRVATLMSVMSSSGARKVSRGKLRAMRVLANRPPRNADLEALVDHYVASFKVIGSPGFPTPDEVLRERLRIGFMRSHRPAGTARQMLAIMASGDRSAALRLIKAPTVVIHGKDDPLVPPEAGVDTAKKIDGAKLRLVPGMGHDLAPGVQAILLEEFTALLAAHPIV